MSPKKEKLNEDSKDVQAGNVSSTRAAEEGPKTLAGNQVTDLGPALTKPTDSLPDYAKDIKGKAPARGPADKDREHKFEDDKITGKLKAEETEENTEEENEVIEEAKKTKAGLMKGVFDKMNKSKKAKLESVFEKMLEMLDDEIVEESVEDSDYKDFVTENTPKEVKVINVDVSEDVEALLKGESDLSEDFKSKAKTIFEAAISAKVNAHVLKLEEEYDNELTEATDSLKETLTNKVDEYLTYVAEEWLKDNKLEVEVGIKAEMFESLVHNMKTVFEDHYITMPEDKLDVVESLASENDKLKSDLNEETAKVIALAKAIEVFTKKDLIDQVAEGLTVTDAEKFKQLAEGVEFDTEKDFTKKLKTVRESYKFGKESSTENKDNSSKEPILGSTPEALVEENKKSEPVSTDKSINSYLTALERFTVKS